MPIQPNQYDAVPYESHPFAHTHPRHLRTVAQVFGLNPPALERARVLELGCAAGGNILPLAADHPEAEIVGIDLSARQVADGQRTVDAVGLRNATLKTMSITDVDESFGKFDYVICHGVFSWVPPAVQGRILDICKRNLTDDGVAFVSYNTLPGWNVVRSFREMMMYHTRFFTDPVSKAQQARGLLTFMEDALKGQTNPYAETIRTEAALLKTQPDSYLLHEHLEENNIQLYFHQFMEMAGQRGLVYLGDATVSTMFTGNLPEQVSRALNAAGDIVRIEQYMDFLNNRRFRNTILCHAGRPINRQLTPALLEKFLFSCMLTPQTRIEDIDLSRNQQVAFVGAVTFTVTDRLMTALMLTLREQNGRPIGLDDLVAKAADKLKLDDTAPLRKMMLDNALRLYLSGGLNLHADPFKEAATVSERPAASALARHQAATQGWVTSQRHMRILLDPVQRLILQALDGVRDVKAVGEGIVARVNSREFSVNKDGQVLTEATAIEAEVARVVGDNLASFARLGLLVA